jgi:hypothetical protein
MYYTKYGSHDIRIRTWNIRGASSQWGGHDVNRKGTSMPASARSTRARAPPWPPCPSAAGRPDRATRCRPRFRRALMLPGGRACARLPGFGRSPASSSTARSRALRVGVLTSRRLRPVAVVGSRLTPRRPAVAEVVLCGSHHPAMDMTLSHAGVSFCLSPRLTWS